MLRTNLRVSDQEYVKLAAARSPGEVGTPSGFRSTLRSCRSYVSEIAWPCSTSEKGNEAEIDPPIDRS